MLTSSQIGGVSMIMIIVLQVKYKKEMTVSQKIRRINYLGNNLLIGSTVAVLFALTYGGTLNPWSSWRTIAPLVIGLLGLGVFIGFRTPWRTGGRLLPLPPPYYAHFASHSGLQNRYIKAVLRRGAAS